MADLFTHFVAARVPGAFVRDRRLQALLVIGTFLPDIAGKGLYWVLRNPDSSVQSTHSIAGILLISYLACLFVEESFRRPSFFALAAGTAIHVLVDMTKDNLGAGAVFPFLPISTRGVELGWIDPENVVLLIPIDAAILGVAWILERRFRRVQQ
jgi:membrane-bound metal-dependent hydrolase YbcI (DUF457 family)